MGVQQLLLVHMSYDVELILTRATMCQVNGGKRKQLRAQQGWDTNFINLKKLKKFFGKIKRKKSFETIRNPRINVVRTIGFVFVLF